MASVSKWKGSIKKFASDLSLVLIQQNALVTTCWAVLAREPGARTMLTRMMGSEVSGNRDCVPAKSSEKDLRPSHGVIHPQPG